MRMAGFSVSRHFNVSMINCAFEISVFTFTKDGLLDGHEMSTRL